MENTHEIEKNELPQGNEFLKGDKDFLDLLGENRGKSKTKSIEESKQTPKRGDGGDLL